MTVKRALITGITGQDGYYLTRFLLEKGYQVEGLARRNARQSLGTLDYLSSEQRKKVAIHWGDITDSVFIAQLIRENSYDEVYHFAAQSFVPQSFTNPYFTYQVNIGGTLHLVNAIRDYSPKTRLYFAATSEMYGLAKQALQNEETPFHPRSPYGVSKLAAFWTVKNYRESYGLFFVNGILFNHESEMRGPEFVTQKIATGVAEVMAGKRAHISLGNLEAKRDWGYAPEYVEGAWRMLQQAAPDDFVLATGEQHSIREFVEVAFASVKMKIEWRGTGVEEEGVNTADGKVIVKIDSELYRPAEVPLLLGDATKAREVLGWAPVTAFSALVDKMVKYQCTRMGHE